MKKNSLTIKQWAEEDRPREKLLLKGKSALSDAELIGILLRSGSRTQSAVDLAKDLLDMTGHDLHHLARLTANDLMKFEGIGEAKAITILSALELGRRRKATDVMRKPKINSSRDAYELMKPDLMDIQHEEFWVMLLKRNHEVIKKERISSGGVSSTIADPKIIFKKALDELASYVILAHNHPSGSLKPSHEDIQLTKKLKSAGKTLDIPVLDHIIFTDHNYFSFADESML